MATLGGTVTGLMGAGLVLEVAVNESQASVTADGPFAFASVPVGVAVTVVVAHQPTNPAQICTVTQSAGVVPPGGANDVQVTCTLESFQVGGTIANLAGQGLVVELDGKDALSIDAGASQFVFATRRSDGAMYAVTVSKQPSMPEQTCSVSSGTGAVAGADVSSVAISCDTLTFMLGGTVTGLGTATGLVLQYAANNALAITDDGPFTFTQPVEDGSSYAVSVAAQPFNLCCSVSDGIGVVHSEDVNVTVICADSVSASCE